VDDLLPAQGKGAKAAGNTDRGVPIQADGGGREARAIAGDRQRIERLPLGDQCLAEDGVPHLLGGCLQVVQRRL
jgi:hypothetical protein